MIQWQQHISGKSVLEMIRAVKISQEMKMEVDRSSVMRKDKNGDCAPVAFGWTPEGRRRKVVNSEVNGGDRADGSC